MQTITEYLSAEHRRCDELFANAEAAAENGDPAATLAGFNALHQEMENHFLKEENSVFLAMERITGSYMTGPTNDMRMEHGQMRGLFEDMQAALEAENTSAYVGMLDTLLMLMQLHNMKEEQSVFKVADRMIVNREEIIREMEALP